MDKVIKNKRGLELVTSPSSGYKTSPKNVTLWNDWIKVTNSQVHGMVLQCSKLFHSIVSTGFLSQDSHISYSFGKIQNQAFINYNFFIYKILGIQNRFRCTSIHVGNCANERADMHVSNNKMIWLQKIYQINIKILSSYKWPPCFSPVYCSFPVDYAISVYMMTTLHSCTLCDIFTLQCYYFWYIEMRSSVAHLIYWPWTMNMFLKIPVQLLTHCQIPSDIWGP